MQDKAVIRHLDSVDFTVIAKPNERSPSRIWDFEVFAILSREPALLWSLPSGTSPDPTDDITQAERFLHGSVRIGISIFRITACCIFAGLNKVKRSEGYSMRFTIWQRS